MTDTKDPTVCRACAGTGKQSFQGLFDSYRATCNFCAGYGTKEEELKWFDSEFTERGFGMVKQVANAD